MKLTVVLAAVAGLALVSIPARAQDQDALLKRGAYLVNGPVACGNCHNARAEDLSFIPGKEFSGGFHIQEEIFDVYTANITPDPDTGIGTWTDEQIITAIREGKTPDGRIIWPPMAVPTYNNMSDDDVKAIVAYLRTLQAARGVSFDSLDPADQARLDGAGGNP